MKLLCNSEEAWGWEMRGVSCSPRVAFLEPVLQCFHENLQRYADAMEWGDLPHYYNERSTLSLFAAACWQSGLVGLEEYVSWKGRGEDTFRGRADLWVCSLEADTDIAIEAKQNWPGLGVRSKTVTEWLNTAEAAACQNYDAKLRAGMTFLVPCLTPTASREQVVTLFRRLHDDALRHGVDALAWWLPEAAMTHSSPNRNTGEDCMWPGVLTVLRVARVRGGRVSSKADRLRESCWAADPVPA